MSVVSEVINRIPVERLLSRTPDNKKRLEELQEILGGAEPKKATEQVTTEETPQHRVHLEHKEGGMSLEETVAYQNREIGKLLLRMEGHCTQKFRALGKICDCLTAGENIYGSANVMSIGKSRGRVLTHTGEFKEIKQHMSRHFKGELCKIQVTYTNIPLFITREHPVFAIWNGWKNNWRTKGGGLKEDDLRWVSAEELTPHSFLAFPRIKKTHDMDIITHSLAELLGWYTAEGSKGKELSDNRIVISLGKHEVEYIERVSYLVNRCFGHQAIIRDRDTSTQVEYTDGAFASIFKEFGPVAIKKHLPQWLLYLPFDKQFAFLKGYLGGDGCPQNKNGYSFSAKTVSQSLAYELRLILFRLGILHSMAKRKQTDGLIDGRRVRGNGFAFEIKVSGEAAKILADAIGYKWSGSFEPSERTRRNLGWVGNNYVFLPVKANELIPYRGKVYNIGVDADNSYVTMHGALHNCGAQKHLLDLESLCEETVSMVDNPDIYYRIIELGKELSPKCLPEAVATLRYDDEFPSYAQKYREFRKELISSLEPTELYPESELPLLE